MIKNSPLLSEIKPSQSAKKAQILGLKVASLQKREALSLCVSYMEDPNNFHHVITANTLLAIEEIENPSLKSICENADVLIPDSIGIIWASKKLKQPSLNLYAGIDLAFDLCRVAAERSFEVFFIGGERNISEEAARTLKKKFPEIKIQAYSGFFDEDQERTILEKISQQQPNLILVGMGVPKQEIWIHEKLKPIYSGLAIGVGGSFDVWAGKTKRAPLWVQRIGFEWIFRLIQEPFRWKRILKLPRFVSLILKEKHRNPR